MAEPMRPRSLSTSDTRTLNVPKSTPATMAIGSPLFQTVDRTGQFRIRLRLRRHTDDNRDDGTDQAAPECEKHVLRLILPFAQGTQLHNSRAPVADLVCHRAKTKTGGLECR